MSKIRDIFKLLALQMDQQTWIIFPKIWVDLWVGFADAVENKNLEELVLKCTTEKHAIIMPLYKDE